jgi:hypothetical protein
MMPRRQDEIEVYALLRAAATLSPASGNRLLLRAQLVDAARRLKIPPRRAGYILDKWEKKDWWHTHNAAGGWFTSRSPAGLLPFSTLEDDHE